MSDTRFTHAMGSILKKAGEFIEGLPKDLGDLGTIITTLVADVAAIKSEVQSGNYPAVIASLQSDLATVKAELAALKNDIAASIKPVTATATNKEV